MESIVLFDAQMASELLLISMPFYKFYDLILSFCFGHIPYTCGSGSCVCAAGLRSIGI